MRHLNALERIGPACIAAGCWEGLHRAHMDLATRTVELAKARGLTPVLISLYDPSAATLSTEEEKAWLLRESGVEVLFSLERGSYQAEDIKKIGGTVLVEAPGLCRAPALPEGIERVVLPPVQGEAECQARLYRAIEEGDVEGYKALAGRPYLMIGQVVHGRKLGRTVGQPTANLEVPQRKCRPAPGVYASISTIEGQTWMGITNIGRRPTVDSFDYVTIETNLLEFDGDLYGKTQQLELHIRVRGVMKFESLEQVKEQVERDKAGVRDQLLQIAQQYRRPSECR